MPRSLLLAPNDLETIRQAASEQGDCETSRLANAALWGTSDRQRNAANRKLARMVAK